MSANVGSKSTISEGLVLCLDAANPSSAKTFDTHPAPWTAASAPDNCGWSSVTYGNGKFVAVAQGGGGGTHLRIMYASESDLTTWTNQSVEQSIWRSITYGNGKFVAVSQNTSSDGTDRVMYASDSDLTTWTTASASEQNDWESVTYGNGKFVAVSDNGTNRVMYASDSDPSSWTAASAAEANSWRSVTYGNGKFVAVSSDGTNRVMYSSDGINWTSASATEAIYWRSVTYGNGKFVAVGSSGTNRVMHSSDGINWTAPASAPAANSWFGVTYGKGIFVAVSYNGINRVMYSYDGGISWSLGTQTEDNQWYSITYGNDTFLAVSSNGTNRIMYSRNVTSPSLRDISLNKITGSLYNSPTFSNTGNSSYIELNTGSITDQYYKMDSMYLSDVRLGALGGIVFTIEFWINRYSGTYILDTRNASDSYCPYITFSAAHSNKLMYRPFGVDPGTFYETATDNPSATDNTWTGWRHYVISRSGTGNTQCPLYYNGTFVSNGRTYYDQTSEEDFKIGVRSYDNASPFKGKIGFFKIYKGKAFTAAEVLQSYNATKERYK